MVAIVSSTAERTRSHRFDRYAQIQKRHRSIRSEGIATVTTQHNDHNITIDGLHEPLLIYYKEYVVSPTHQLPTSFIRLISIIKQIHQLNVYDEKDEVAVDGNMPAYQALCFARVVSRFKKKLWEIKELK